MSAIHPMRRFECMGSSEGASLECEYEFLDSFAEVFEEQSLVGGEFSAIRDSFVSLAPRGLPFRDRIEIYWKAVASSGLLRGREKDNLDAHAARVAGVVTRHRGLDAADEACEMLGSVAIAALQRAVDEGLDSRGRMGLGESIEATFRQVRSIVCARRPAVRTR
jgi:hypothetical protein